MLKWYEKIGEDSDVIISSKVRLARNLPEYNFSLKLNNKDAKQMVNHVFQKLKGLELLKNYKTYNFETLDKLKKSAMQESNLISPFLVNQSVAAGFYSSDEHVSIMLNEEDHIRIQVFYPGNDMLSAYKMADRIDDAISGLFEYAYNSRFGYFTTCPSNVGTGMRASYVLHLPALSNTGKLNGIASEIGRFGLTMHPIYGDGSESMGDLYLVSNQITLGMTEKEIIDNLSNIVQQIVQQERASRRQYISRNRIGAEDIAFRSYGVLKYARKITLNDAMILLSELRMGLEMGLLKPAVNEKISIYKLIIGIQPANLQLAAEKQIPEDEILVERARYIRENLPLI